MTNPYATIRAALESIRVCDDMTGEREAALAALAELEKELAAAVAERDSALDKLSVAIGKCWCKRATLHAELIP